MKKAHPRLLVNAQTLPSFSGNWQQVRMCGGGSQFSSILACSFLGTRLPANLELEGNSPTDGGARVREENSCSTIVFLRLLSKLSLGCLTT